MINIIELPPRLDHQGARHLHAALAAQPRTDTRVDAGRVTFVGGLALQVLLSAAATWRAAGHRFTCEPVSDAFIEDIARMGADPTEFHEDHEPCR